MLRHGVFRRNASDTSPAGETSRTWSPRWSPVKSDPSRAHLGASPLLSAHVTSGVTPIRHVLKELKNERGSRRRENSLGLGLVAMLPRTPRTATTLRCTWREAQARTRKRGVVGEVGRLSHWSGRGVRMPPPSEHSGGGGGVGWEIGLGEWVGVSIVTSEFVTTARKKTGTKGTHTHSPWLFFFESG